MLKLIECPRDAMQGIDTFIPTNLKVKYINQLLKVGFDTIDFGSFVSPKAIPQMRDTEEVLSKLDKRNTNLLAIVANQKGVDKVCSFSEIDYLGYPFSISETFQLRNTNKSIAESKVLLEQIKASCDKYDKKMVVYLSMGFGNPYGDEYSNEIVAKYTEYLIELGVEVISLSDTIGSSDPMQIIDLFSELKSLSNKVEFGAHLHSRADQIPEKVKALIDAGCNRIDTAFGGLGGCPMAQDDLVGNLATESVITSLKHLGIVTPLDMKEFSVAQKMYNEIFPTNLIQ
ncbi:hydroxymethylglutaryl-CoA lyase [Sediminitomix flava]|uniref:Hydroxymethylglutaryl-CoA lyase n=1 Tax=Sediminitomix flava TaxID=379075 RepID=A0A315Z9X2_SEDFL|nr:hydroxymethylglutaryl-CoA lyase [Sediminitomix flava]PWJ42375.1 hydroxymethylglutaryl-CoA lyase [Sediminitomix flava]